MKTTLRTELMKIDEELRTLMGRFATVMAEEAKSDVVTKIRRSYLHVAHAQLYTEELVGE